MNSSLPFMVYLHSIPRPARFPTGHFTSFWVGKFVAAIISFRIPGRVGLDICTCDSLEKSCITIAYIRFLHAIC